MRFTCDAQRKAMFANMMNGTISGSNTVKFSSGSKKDEGYKLLEEAVNEGYWTCPRCGNRMEPDVGTCGECKYKAKELIDLGLASEFSKDVDSKFSEKAEEEFKEGLNGFVCPKCGDVVDEDSIGSHSCDESGVNSVYELESSYFSDSSSGGSRTVVEEHIIEDDYDYDYDDEDEEDSLFG